MKIQCPLQVMDLVDELFLKMFDKTHKNRQKELESINRQYPFEPLKVCSSNSKEDEERNRTTELKNSLDTRLIFLEKALVPSQTSLSNYLRLICLRENCRWSTAFKGRRTNSYKQQVF